MKLFLDKDFFESPKVPRVYLCNTSKTIISELPVINLHGTFKWGTYSEISFDLPRTYVDMLSGETKVHPAYDKVEAPRNVLVENYGYFALQDIDDTSNDNDIKSVTAFSLEYATSNKYLTNWFINTGEVDSKEVLYNESLYGTDYNTDQDSFYKLASGEFDPYESYYSWNYVDSDSHIYEQISIRDAVKYQEYLDFNKQEDALPQQKLYVKKFSNVQFYNPNKKGLSLLHLIFENIPDWRIGNVDQALWRKERRFSEDRISVYDFIQNNLRDTFGCATVWDSLSGKVHFYEELEDDDESNSEATTRFETDVFISKDNLASETKVSYSSDNIKTKLVVTGGEDLDIREVNLGRNEIMDLSFYHTLEWMESDLFEAYSKYLNALNEAETGFDRYGYPSTNYPVSYTDAMKGWVSANNAYNDLMNAVPVGDNVVLVGDEFKKLYCTYHPFDTVYYDGTINQGTYYILAEDLYVDEKLTKPIEVPTGVKTYVAQGALLVYSEQEKKFEVNMNNDVNQLALISQLNVYHVDKDTTANKQDNILLKLKHPTSSNTATIRIYDKRKVATEYAKKVKYYAKTIDGKWFDNPISISNGVEFNEKKQEYGNRLYTNDYYIQSVVINALTGISEEPDEYPISQWLNDELTAKKMELEEYKITYIGTMGAYFVLAKDEKNPDNLQDYGIRLLEEKHKTYTTIFQTQTEAMFSQEKLQCIVQDDEPVGDYSTGTRWLDTNSNPITLKEVQEVDRVRKWVVINPDVSELEREKYENYQRYIDNYEKLQAVQEVLTAKKRNAEYCKEGQLVTDRQIDTTLYTKDEDGFYRYNGGLLEEHLRAAAVDYFNGIPDVKHTITRISVDQSFPLYTFITSADPIIYEPNTQEFNLHTQYYVNPVISTYGKNTEPFNPDTEYYIKDSTTLTYNMVEIADEFVFESYGGNAENTQLYIIVEMDNTLVYVPITIANESDFDAIEKEKTLYVVTSGHFYAVYLKDKIPYVAYANSEGVYDMIMQYIRNKTEMNRFFTTDQWIRLSPFIKEDEFSDQNFFLSGTESEEAKTEIRKELMDAAWKELKTLCKPSLEFSMSMANIFALPEFKPLIEQFQLGNFIRVGVREDYVKRARLLEVDMNFDNLSDFSCKFGNLTTAKSEVDKHAELLAQAISAGKQVAKASGSWQKTVDEVNKLEEAIENGLQNVGLQIGRASGQAITWDETGFRCRKLVDGTTDQYEDEQIAIINNKIAITTDGGKNWDAAFGEFEIDTNGDGIDETLYGVIAKAVIAGYIEGSTIKGGSLEIGGSGGTFIVHNDGSVEILGPDNTEKYADKSLVSGYQFRIALEYEGSTIFVDRLDRCIVTCKVYSNATDITDKVLAQADSVFTWSKASNSNWKPTYVTDTIPNKILITHEDIERNASFACSVSFDETQFETEGGASE